ncbi:MAG TPA: hypothetical protein VFV87_22155, partial [Pirellulaceae bacterium]|nr:hypothetical protein [Pirellulaceae bacterium]
INRQPFMLAQALVMVARSGDAKHLPEVEKLLEDASVITRMQENNGNQGKPVMYEIQVLDVALATAALLSKQELKAYFENAPQPDQTTDWQQVFFNARVIGSSSDEQRTKTFAKWAAFKAKQGTPEAASP